MTKRIHGPGPNPSGLCQCGCGQQTPLARISCTARGTVKGQPVCFVYGHQVKKMRVLNTQHGLSDTPEWRAYWNARNRCTNPEHAQYGDYGARGIEFRFVTFEEFLAEVGPRPSAKHSIDRRNNNGHYEPGNLRWATDVTQQRNTRLTKLSPQAVDEILRRKDSGETGRSLAQRFNVSIALISGVINKKRWTKKG